MEAVISAAIAICSSACSMEGSQRVRVHQIAALVYWDAAVCLRTLPQRWDCQIWDAFHCFMAPPKLLLYTCSWIRGNFWWKTANLEGGRRYLSLPET